MQFLKQYKGQFPSGVCKQLIDIAEDPEGYSYAAGVMRGNTSLVDKRAMDSTTLELGSKYTKKLTKELCQELEHHLFPALTHYINECSPQIQIGDRIAEMSIEDVKRKYFLTQPPRLNRYKIPNQAYHGWHTDWGPCTKEREISCILYLNDVEVGGETEFYHQGVKIKPEEGKIIISPSGFTHIHRSVPPISNDKYICIFWVGRDPN